MANFIYIARHAWAHEFGDPRWPDDSLRELEFDGAERYLRVVEALAERGFAPEVIATSPYTRCVQTAELISEHTVHHPEVVSVPALEPGSDFDAVAQWSREIGCSSLCWVGHAPDVGLLTAALIGDHRANIRFAKGATAAIRYHAEIGPDCGELMWHVTAKSLGL